MSLADTFGRVKSGVFHIVYLDSANNRLSSGSAFATCGYLVTNHHVFLGPANSRVWIRREGQNDPGQGVIMPCNDFMRRLRSGSDINNFDFAVMDFPEIVAAEGVHNFTLRSPVAFRPGDQIAFAGYPFEHDNLTIHGGMISSFYSSGPAQIVQLDASVNASNSGGPMFDVETGEAIGMITRKATGLTRAFHGFRETLLGNIQMLTQARQGGGRILIGGVDPGEVALVSQRQMLVTLSEIERQANVGIGYAFSADHLINDNVIHAAIEQTT